ncbi:MAG: protein kinase domain-containing protein [Patescibacteria group bacterium]
MNENFEKLSSDREIEKEWTSDEYEQAIEEIIEKFPDELQDNMYEELDNVDKENTSQIKELYSKVNEKLEKRRGFFKKRFPGYQAREEKLFTENLLSGLPENLKERTLEEFKTLTEEMGTEKYELLGQGLSADVKIKRIEIPEGVEKNICYKTIERIENYRNDNDIGLEMELQETCSRIENNDTACRVPRPYYYNMDEYSHICAMEQIEGASIKEVLNKEKLLPENFDLERFFDNTIAYLEKMHNAGLYHRDLHAGNIMVDYESSDPVIIDFGKSIDTNKQYTNDPYTEGGKYLNDIESLKEIRYRLTTFIKENKGD